MQCSHGIPYECKCKMCVEEAMQHIRTQPQRPKPQATPAQVQDFWVSTYRQSVTPNKY